jgi:hypothetical protein
MLNNASERIWICSRFITEFWTDIMNLKREKPNLDVKIITLPKAEAHNKYKGAGKIFVQPAFDALQRLLGKDFITEPLLHARLYIVDTLRILLLNNLRKNLMQAYGQEMRKL